MSEPPATVVHVDLDAIRLAWTSRDSAKLGSEQAGTCQYSAASLKVMKMRENTTVWDMHFRGAQTLLDHAMMLAGG